MRKIKLGIIKETKSPIDKRVPLTPNQIMSISSLYPELEIIIEPSEIRCFSDEEYGSFIESDSKKFNQCDFYVGVKEVNVEKLKENKTYLFFSHTIKKQPYNRELLKACVEKNITLIDYEVIRNVENDKRLIGFGDVAGIVGAYNSLKAYADYILGKTLKSAFELEDVNALVDQIDSLSLSSIRILLTGKGLVGKGAKEFLTNCGFEEISLEDYLNEKTEGLVFTNVDYKDYYKENKSCLSSFLHNTDILITGHYYKNGDPVILDKQSLKNLNRLKVIGDISCDINGPIESTIRSTTINEPVFFYDKFAFEETNNLDENSIIVMAVDNLPCEMAELASERFGDKFINNVISELFLVESEVIKNATICSDGKLSTNYSYLNDYLNF